MSQMTQPQPPPYGQDPTPKKVKPGFFRRWYMIAAYVIIALVVGANIGGGNTATQTTAAAKPEPGPTVTVTAAAKAGKSAPAPGITVTAAAKPAPTVTVTAKAAAPKTGADSAVSSSDVDGDWRLVSLVTKEEFGGDWTGTARIKYTGSDSSAEGSFTITLFKGSSQTPEATLMGTASSVEPGRTVTVDLISTDKYHSGHYRHEFQKDF